MVVLKSLQGILLHVGGLSTLCGSFIICVPCIGSIIMAKDAVTQHKTLAKLARQKPVKKVTPLPIYFLNN